MPVLRQVHEWLEKNKWRIYRILPRDDLKKKSSILPEFVLHGAKNA